MRYQDWPVRLAAFVAANRDRPFVWGEWDCASMALAWVEEATGERPYVATHTDVTSAAHALVDLGGGMEQAATAVFGEPREHVGHAQRGDIALVEIEGHDSLTVVLGEWVVGPGEEGLAYRPRAEMKKAWAI
jgi:hypothetical protein